MMNSVWFWGANKIPFAACSGNLLDDMSGLQIYYKMDGNATDSSGNGNDGTPTGITYTTGKFATASVFGTSSAYITAPQKDYSISTNFSISAWIKTTQTEYGQQIFSDDVVGTRRVFQFRIEGTSGAINSAIGGVGLVRFDSGGSVVTTIAGTPSVTDNQWHHVAATFDNTVGSKVYVDGVEVDSDSVTTNNYSPATCQPMISSSTIPPGPGSGRVIQYIEGDLDDLSFWNRTLSSTEIQTLAAGTCPLSTDEFRPDWISGLNLWLDVNDQSTLNGGSGASNGATVSSWLDKSPNAYLFTQSTDSLRPTYVTGTDEKLNFTAANDNLKVSVSQPFNDTSGTLYFSFYYNNSGNDQILFASGDEGGSNYIILGARSLGGTLNKLQIQTNSAGVLYANTTTLVNGTYYYGYISSNGTTISMRVNGVDQVSFTGTNDGTWFGDLSGRDNLSINNMFRSTTYSSGLAEVNKLCYFNRVLTTDEITKMDNYMSNPLN